MGKISLQNCLSEILNSEVLFLLLLPFTLLLCQAIWGYLMVCHVSLYFKETFISWWWECLPCTFYDKKLVFKGGCAALFVMNEDRNCFGGNHDPAVIICAQRDRSTRARFHSVSWRPLKRLWWFKLPWELHKIIQGVSQEEDCWLMLVPGATCCPQSLVLLWGHPCSPSGPHPPTPAGSACSAPALCPLGTEQEAEQLH